MLIRLTVDALGGMWPLRRACMNAGSGPLRRVLLGIYRAYNAEFGASVAWNAQFAGPPCFPHNINGVFVSGDARVGRDCVIFQQVTIGSNTLGDSKGGGAPTVGDRCYIGAGAKIIGNITIGNDVRVGANCVVVEDVPDNAVVIPGESRIVTRAAPKDNRFYTYRDGWKYFSDGRWIAVADPVRTEKLERQRVR
jgi:serine O-acetyltransferase